MKDIINPIKFISDEKNLSKAGMITIDQSMSSADRKRLAKEYYEGMVGLTNKNQLYEIIEYNTVDNIMIRFFDQGHTTQKIGSRQIKSGLIKSPYDLNKYGGYMGEGPYDQKTQLGKKIYFTWYNMIRRITEEYSNQRADMGYYSYNTYINGQVIICNEWYNFQVFAKWYADYYSKLVPDSNELKLNYQLDKDIFQWKMNPKIYGPNTCCIIPALLNNAIAGIYNDKPTTNLPPGVQFVDATYTTKKYQAVVQLGCVRKCLGTYETPEEAFNVYKQHKESDIRSLADDFYDKGYILKNVKDAIYNISI